ncbi:MAG: hypothetical protein Q9M94_02570 [Candidatus Gracilibacteria bacterium]|nr:hypothetical protein [Candidatus Gracilibacteria bacterium]MDQ7022671.1 hypothetical protein [Candidatus Gracilibacteria bacterium]
MKKNKKAFSIVIAIGLVLVMSLLVLYIIEYMIPYSKNVKGIENSSNAFYQAENSIEEGLYFFSTRGTGSIEKFADKNKTFGSLSVDYKYNTTSSGNLIPYNGEGNSEFDTTFNKISQGNPIQLDIGNGLNIDWSDSSYKIDFNIPDLDNNNTETLSGGTTTAIINWQISADDDTLNATGSWITADEINGGEFNMGNKQGINLNGDEGSSDQFQNFYSSKCGTGSGCSLKFSIINKLELTTNNTSVPYLEYKFNFDTNIPLRYSRIKSSGKSYGFQKYLEVRIPQQTTNEAFDFTVFQ